MKRMLALACFLAVALSVQAANKGPELKTDFGEIRTIAGSAEVFRTEQDGDFSVFLYVTDERRIDRVLLSLSPRQARELGMMLAMAAAGPDEPEK